MTDKRWKATERIEYGRLRRPEVAGDSRGEG